MGIFTKKEDEQRGGFFRAAGLFILGMIASLGIQKLGHRMNQRKLEAGETSYADRQIVPSPS